MIKKLSVLSVALGVVSADVLAEPTIDRLAPEDSVFVVSVENVQRSLERLKRTSLWALWESEQMKALRADAIEQCEEKLDELFQELAVEQGSLVAPQGQVGIAVFPVMQEDLNVATPGFLLVADYGANADKTARLIDAMIVKTEEQDGLEYERKEILGRTIYSFDFSGIEVEDVIEFDDIQMDQLAPMMPVPDPAAVLGEFEAMHYVRDGSRFIVCSDLDTLTEALEAIDGEDRAGLVGRADFQAVLAKLGEVDAYAVFLTRDLARVVGGSDPMMAQMLQGMVEMIIGDIEGVGFGVRLDGPSAMVQETFALYMPNGKSGLTALMDTQTPRTDPPPFIGPDAASYSSINFEFDGVMDFIRGIGQGNPMLQGQIDQFLFEYGPTIEQVLNALGSQVHSAVTVSRPIGLSSLKSLYAIECTKPEQIEQLLAEYAGPLGLEPRDFLGQRIYTMAFNPLMMIGGPMMPPGDGDTLSIGFGGGYVMLGTTSVVEDALRATGGGDGPSLGADTAYRRAIRALPAGGAVAWGLLSVVDYVEFFKDFSAMARQQMIDQMQQWDPEVAEKMRAEMQAQALHPLADFDLGLLKRYLGPVAWQLQSSEDGFVGSYYLLEASPVQR